MWKGGSQKQDEYNSQGWVENICFIHFLLIFFKCWQKLFWPCWDVPRIKMAASQCHLYFQAIREINRQMTIICCVWCFKRFMYKVDGLILHGGFSQKDGEEKGNSMCEGSNGYEFGTCEEKHKVRHDALPQGTGKTMGVLREKLWSLLDSDWEANVGPTREFGGIEEAGTDVVKSLIKESSREGIEDWLEGKKLGSFFVAHPYHRFHYIQGAFLPMGCSEYQSIR